MWSAASTTGSRGIWLSAHGTGGARSVFDVNTNNYVTISGDNTWGGQVRMVDNWVGFYKDVRGTGTRYGYIQANADRMYFRKENGANNNIEFDFDGDVYASGELISNAYNGLRIRNLMLRNDGSNTYFLFGTSNTPGDNWNSLRPIYFNNSSGDVYMCHTVRITGVFQVGYDNTAYHWTAGAGTSYAWLDLRNGSNAMIHNIVGYSDRIYLSKVQVGSHFNTSYEFSTGSISVGGNLTISSNGNLATNGTVVFTGGQCNGDLFINSTSGATATNNAGCLVVGSKTWSNLGIDGNEI